jgi:transcriptional regulator with XRE-family HTH domain
METVKDKKQIEHLAANILAAMELRSMSQETLERRSGVPQATISRILNAKSNPAVTHVVRLARALRTSVDLLMAEPIEENASTSS